MKRRDFLTHSGLVGMGAALTSRFGAAQSIHPQPPVGSARNIIFYVYDGFSWEDLAVARHFMHRSQGKALALERLLTLGRAGSMFTHSLTSIITDSAAASTAFGTGRKTANGNIGVFPDGRKLTTILEVAKGQGKATGLITTARVTHATPAGCSVHVENRDDEDEIAAQYLELQPDVILGGGARHFGSATRGDGRDLYGEFAAKGYSVVKTVDEMGAFKGSRVLGTFSNSHMPYEIDRRYQGVEGPSLADMTRKGLDLLSAASRGFVVQVEAGRIDHANHNNDPGAMLWDVLAADEALQNILEFTDRNPGTLLILGADHGTGGGAIYGIGSEYQRSSTSFDRIGSRKASYEYILDQLGESPKASDIAEAAGTYLGLNLKPEKASIIADAIQGHPRIANIAAYHEQPANSLASVVAGGMNFDDPDNLNIQYSAGQHTAGPVPVAVYGAGTTAAQLGLVDITQIYPWMTGALGVDHENPVMSEAEALSILEGTEAATGTEG